MATWAEFAAAEPEVAAAAFPKPPDMFFALAYLATVRPDGGPRVHPFCPIFAGESPFAAIPRSSPKGNDLRRDGRYVIHALPGRDDAEFSLAGGPARSPARRCGRWWGLPSPGAGSAE